MDLNVNKVTILGLMISIIGVILELSGVMTYSINDIRVFPFVIIPIGVMISLLGFVIGARKK